MSTQFSWRLKVILICFGLAIGGAGGYAGLLIYRHSKAGSEFATLDDLRRSMLVPDNQTDATGSVNLRAIITAHPDDKIIYDLRPNLNVRFQRAQVNTNSCGMRGPERPVAKPPGVYRIALLGDSFTFGWGVEQKETFAQVLEDNLNRESQGNPRFEVLNFGVPGYSTFQEVSKFMETGLDFQPDAALVFFIDNDFGLPFFVRDLGTPGEIQSSTNFSQLLLQSRDPRMEEEQLKLKGLDPNKSLRDLADTCSKAGIPLFFTINPKKDWKSLRKRLWILKERDDITFITLRPEFMKSVKERGIATKDLTLSFDPHPSPIKHRLLGDLLTQYFLSVIRS